MIFERTGTRVGPATSKESKSIFQSSKWLNQQYKYSFREWNLSPYYSENVEKIKQQNIKET